MTNLLAATLDHPLARNDEHPKPSTTDLYVVVVFLFLVSF